MSSPVVETKGVPHAQRPVLQRNLLSTTRRGKQRNPGTYASLTAPINMIRDGQSPAYDNPSFTWTHPANAHQEQLDSHTKMNFDWRAK